MLLYFRPMLLAFSGVVFLAFPGLSSSADDYLNRAAQQYREKDFGDAYTLAGKSVDLTQRSFLRGMAAFRLDKFEEAALLLAEAEQKLPLVADYAAYYHAEALFKLKRYSAASAKAAPFASAFPSSRLIRRSEKLSADILYEAGDYKGALKSYQSYIEKYTSGSDAIDASYSLARCREELADPSGAQMIYRSIWLNSPASPFAAQSQERLKQLEKSPLKAIPYTSEELLKRASALYVQNEFTASLKTLEMIPAETQSQAIATRIGLRVGMARYRLRQYKLAEKEFAKVSVSPLTGPRSEARFWLAKSLDRQNLKERALALYLELAGGGKKQEFADGALVEAARLQRGLGQYGEAARLFDQAVRISSESKAVGRLTWDAGWCRYLAGEYLAAVEIFKRLLHDETQREKALYWLGRALEKSGDTAASYYLALQNEFPAGFYATWYRDQKGIKDNREALGNRDAVAELPLLAGFDKPRLLAALGLFEESRAEAAVVRKKNGERKSPFPALARLFLEMHDYGSAISLFMQNRPIAWEKGTLPLWTAGYPRAYPELISQNARLNDLSEGLVYALIRAESGFTSAIKSSAGAIGLMQMMPATAKMTAHEKGEFNPRRLIDPEYNIRLGTKHLYDLMKVQSGDVVYVAAAYNAGSGALERWKKSFKGLSKDEFIESIPYQETRDYVKKVYASAATYRQLYGLK
ncbi:MAG: transglycosylase SLT domain-containing protein [Desulfuromonadaceae bacterium]|nr:transglycosylase SLT domain-containing protein [Desulfuromonadaceae bacterium]